MTYITRNFLVTGGPGAEHSLLGQVQMSTNFDKQHFTVCDHLLINIIELLLNIGSPKVAHSQVLNLSQFSYFSLKSGLEVLCCVKNYILHSGKSWYSSLMLFSLLSHVLLSSMLSPGWIITCHIIFFNTKVGIQGCYCCPCFTF